MREILFKAKTKLIVGTYNMGKEDGEWVKGYLRCDCGKWLIYQFETDYADQIAYEVDPDTICQYTGLTDKNGNKIWENDIVKRYNENGDEWRISKIVWADHSLNMGWCIEDVKSLTEYSNRLFKVGFDVNDTEKCEVIGNIFDNADLLKGE